MIDSNKTLTPEERKKDHETIKELASFSDRDAWQIAEDAIREILIEGAPEIESAVGDTFNDITKRTNELIKRADWKEDWEEWAWRIALDESGDVAGFDAASANALFADLLGLLDNLTIENVSEDTIRRWKGVTKLFYETSSAVEKWRGLLWIVETLSNRINAWRLLQRETEAVFHTFWDFIFKQMYRKIRDQLQQREEKRAFHT